MSAIDNWVVKAYSLLHEHILKYTSGTPIPPEWVAGLIFVECARLDPKATRFEPHVYKAVELAKKGQTPASFPGFRTNTILYKFIKETSNIEDLKSVASSYGLGQIMGYHYIEKWGLKPEQFRNLTNEQSIRYTVAFMMIGMKFAQGNYGNLMRWWNTGSINGKTYHANYVLNAQSAMMSYKKYMEKMNPPKVEAIPQPPSDLQIMYDKIIELEKLLNKFEDRLNKLEDLVENKLL